MLFTTGIIPWLGKIIFWLLQYLYSKILSFAYGGPAKGTPVVKSSVLTESATSLAKRIRNEKVTSTEVVRAYIYRIKEINDELNCVVDERFEEALKEAGRADDLIRSGAKSKEDIERDTPFLGVPFTAEDSMGVKGLLNTRGTWRRRVRAAEDAEPVALLRSAGAIPLASTNVAEFSRGRETDNPVFGRTRNPYGANRSVGGPSGGGPCLVAAAGSPLSVASDRGGAFRIPCAFAGVFGHKPSADCPSAFHGSVGPTSRSSADLLPALQVLTKNSRTDLKLGEPVDLKRLRYYFVDGYGGSELASPVEAEIKEAIRKAVDHFRNGLKARVERIDLKPMKDAYFIWKAQTGDETFPPGKDGRRLKLRTEIVKAIFGRSRHKFLFLLTEWLEENLRAFNGSGAKNLAEDCAQLFRELQDLLGTDGVFICPTQPTAAFHHGESLTKGFNAGYAAIFDALGLPATHCPAGLDHRGLPVGFQVVGAMHQDRLTIAVAREVERAFGGWHPPPTTATFVLKSAAFRNAANEKLDHL